MHELVGKAREEDEQFWQQLGVFQEAESDVDYVASSAGEDVVDSDFDQPEEEDKENETESTKERDTKKKHIGYKPPVPVKHHKAAAEMPDATNGEVIVLGEGEAQQPKKIKRITAEVSLPIEQVFQRNLRRIAFGSSERKDIGAN